MREGQQSDSDRLEMGKCVELVACTVHIVTLYLYL
jgi:hypothetical protein